MAVSMEGISFNSLPHWLEILLGEKFFVPCPNHESAKKNEKNIFCLGCCISICPHCLPSHRSHCFLQIRRYVYHDVIRLGDAQKLLNCSLVQPYTTNSAKVVFLKQRPMSRPFRGSGKFCVTCDRSLQDPYLFCSLSCKAHHLATTKAGIQKRHKKSELLGLPESGSVSEVEDDRTTPDSVLDSPGSLSGSTNSTAGGSVAITTSTGPLATFVKKRRSSVSLVAGVIFRSRCSRTAEIGRRKGVPQRSPLY